MWHYVKDIWDSFKCALGKPPVTQPFPQTIIVLRGEHMHIIFTCTDTAKIRIGSNEDTYPAGTHSVNINSTAEQDVWISGTVTAIELYQNVAYIWYSKYLTSVTISQHNDLHTIDTRSAQQLTVQTLNQPSTNNVKEIYWSDSNSLIQPLKRMIQNSSGTGDLYISRTHPILAQAAIDKGWRIYEL